MTPPVDSQWAETMLGLAEAQLLGFTHGRQGLSIYELVSSMGLTADEWTELQKQYGLGYLTADDKKEIEDYLEANQ